MDNNKIKYTVYILHSSRLFNISTQGNDGEQNIWKLYLNENLSIVDYKIFKRSVNSSKYKNTRMYYNNRFFQSLDAFNDWRINSKIY